MPEMHFCANCGNEIDLSKDNYFIDDWDGQYYCTDCAAKVIKECPKCGRLIAEHYMKDGLCCICYTRENRPRNNIELDYSQVRILPLVGEETTHSNIELRPVAINENGIDLGSNLDGLTLPTMD